MSMTFKEALSFKGLHLAPKTGNERFHAERWWRGETDLLLRGRTPKNTVRMTDLKAARKVILAAKTKAPREPRNDQP